MKQQGWFTGMRTRKSTPEFGAKSPTAISNLRTYYSIHLHSSLREIRNLGLPKMRTRQMRESSSKESALVGSGPSKSLILGCLKSFGIARR